MNELRPFLIKMILFISHCLGHYGFNIDVSCDQRHIGVRITFDELFHGTVFSKGFHRISACRYLNEGSNVKVHTFEIGVGRCGTYFEELNNTLSIRNNMVVQRNPFIQTSSDSEVNLSCELYNDIKHLTSSISKVKTDSVDHSDAVKAWLDLKLATSRKNDLVYVGDKVIAVIYVRDGGRNSNALIKNCIAKNVQEQSTIKLLDKFGCAVNGDLLCSFNVSAASSRMDANIVALAEMNAFRFADSDELSLECEIQLCEIFCSKACGNNILETILNGQMKKRSHSHEDETRHLMQRTKNMLASSLKKFRQSNVNKSKDNVMLKNGTDPETSRSNEPQSFVRDGSLKFSNFVNIQEENFVLKVATNLTVLSSINNPYFQEGHSLNKERNLCFPTGRFMFTGIFLCFILICLLVLNISMAVYIKNTNKRKKIGEFLLYRGILLNGTK